MFQANGVGGKVLFDGEKIIIVRKGILSFVAHGLKGNKYILIDSVTSLQFKNASNYTNGYIQFAFQGGIEAKGGLLQATSDENSIMFTIFKQKEFEELRNKIETALRTRRNPRPVTNFSMADELKKLSDMHKEGILDFHEFDIQKKRLLEADGNTSDPSGAVTEAYPSILQNSVAQPTANSLISGTICWLLGIGFLIGGINIFSESKIAGIPMIAASFLLIPPIFNYFRRDNGNAIMSGRMRLSLVIALFIASAIIMSETEPASTKNNKNINNNKISNNKAS